MSFWKTEEPVTETYDSAPSAVLEPTCVLEYQRKGLLRRRSLVPVWVEPADAQAEEPVESHENGNGHAPYSNGNGNGQHEPFANGNGNGHHAPGNGNGNGSNGNGTAVYDRPWTIVSEPVVEEPAPHHLDPEPDVVLEYRRRGLLRRRRLVAVEREHAVEEHAANGNGNGNGNGHAWSIVAEPYQAQVEHAGDEAEQETIETPRRAFFRRHRFDPVPTTFEDVDVPDETPDTHVAGNGHSWIELPPAEETQFTVVAEEPMSPEPTRYEYRGRGLFGAALPGSEPEQPLDDEADRSAAAGEDEVQRWIDAWHASADPAHEPEQSEPDVEPAEPYDEPATDEPTFGADGLEDVRSEEEPADGEEPEVESKRKRHFWQRKPKDEPVEAVADVDDDWEYERDSAGDEDAREFVVVPADDEPAPVFDDVAAVSEDEVLEHVDADEEPPAAKTRRSLFRRRKDEPEADETYGPEAPLYDDVADDHDEPLETNVELELDEPVSKPKRRGLFRRRAEKAVAADDVEHELSPPALEDDDVAPWGAEPVAEEWHEPEPVETFAADEADHDPAEHGEPAYDEPAPEETAYGEPAYGEPAYGEPAYEPAAEHAEPESVELEYAEPPSEPVFEPVQAEEPAEAEPGVHADEAPTYVMGEEVDAETALDLEPAELEEPGYEPAGEGEVEAVEHDEAVPTAFAHDELVDEADDGDDADASRRKPVPLRKRNGSAPRGRKVVGLKVGASQLAAAVVAGSGEQPALVDIARRPLEQGVVVDGEVRDAEALVHALKTFFKDHNLPSKNVRLGLSSSRVGVRTFDVAIDDESRFDNAVRFKAHEVLPVAAHESVLDYRVVEERYTESGEISRHVLLVVAPRDQVQPYIDVCQEAGLRLAGVDLEAFGLLRAFVPPVGVRSDDSAVVVVSVGHESSTLLVAGGGVCEFTRVFDWGGGDLQSAIADELEVPHMEAATILTHLSLSGPGRHLESLDADNRSRALEAVRTRLMPFARELVSSLQFYQTQPDSLGIREILITGGTSHLEGLADSLHQMIGVNVHVGDPLGRVAVQTEIPPALDATIGSLAVPIGLAIEDEPERSANLLPKDHRQARKRPNMLAVAAPVAAVVPLAALGFLFVNASGTVSDRQAELDAVRSQLAALPEPPKANIDPSLVGEQATRATAVAQILGGRLTWERVLGDVSRVLPPGVSLTELAATAPQPTTPETPVASEEGSTSTPAPAPAPTTSTPTAVTVTGYSLDYADIARTLARIQAVPSLVNAQLQSATPGLIGQKRVIEFTIVADLATATGGVQ